MKRRKRCLEPGCNELTLGTRCNRHRKAREAARSQTRKLVGEPWRTLYSTKRWRATREHVFARDGHRCRVVDEETGERCTVTDPSGATLEAHHRVSLRDAYEIGGLEAVHKVAFDEANVLTLCVGHHHEEEAGVRRARAAFSRAKPLEV